MNLWLVGMMGSGKTTVGRLVADRLQMGFFDTDEEIVRLMGCSVAQFWGERGEAAFRDLERVTILKMAAEGAVIATGGGVPLVAENRATMRSSGETVWLTVTPEASVERFDGDETERPLLASAEDMVGSLETMLRERSDAYASIADMQIDTTGKPPEQVADEICAWWRP